MPNTTTFDFADVVLVPFPFTDQSTTKKGPAIVISSTAYHKQRPDLILMAIASQFRPAQTVGEFVVQHRQAAGLIKPSVLNPLITTIESARAARYGRAARRGSRRATQRARRYSRQVIPYSARDDASADHERA
jgi:mRNA interferase MazF